MLGWKTEGRFMGKQAHTKKLNRKHSDLTKIRHKNGMDKKENNKTTTSYISLTQIKDIYRYINAMEVINR